MSNPKTFLFLVQGEGRGHMTQAISLFQILTGAGHHVPLVFIGKSNRREIPAYFSRQVSTRIEPIESPNFVSDKNNKKIRLLPSILYNLPRLPIYWKSMKKINQAIKEYRPDAVINFYEFLGGFFFLLFRPKTKHIVTGHQYLAFHPAFKFAGGFPMDKFLFKVNNLLTSFYASKRLALSFREYQPPATGKTIVCPPLLRKEIHDQQPSKEPFFLAYMVNDGYAQQISDWHERNREVVVHCFWDRKGEPEEKSVHQNLIFHQLNAEKFLDKMARCSGLVTTAGFESICEAMYFGKPVLMIPVEGQYEQECNAIDAEMAGAGITERQFNISKLIEHGKNYDSVSERFRDWLSQTNQIMLRELCDPN